MAESELTEMAGVAEAETQAAYAWALDYDGDDLPTQRLTSRRITTLALAASLVVIAVAGAVALVVPRLKSSEPVVVAPAAVLDGTYRFDYDCTQSTVMGSPNSPRRSIHVRNILDCFPIHMHPSRMYCHVNGVGRQDSHRCEHAVHHTPMAFHQWSMGNFAGSRTGGRWIGALTMTARW